MLESTFFKPVALAAAIITLIESLAWSVLSLLSILCYNDIIPYNIKNTAKGNKLFIDILYELYYSGNYYYLDYRIINQDAFYIFGWFYFITSVFWCFSSGVQIVLISREDKSRKIFSSTGVWLLLSYLVCTLDLIVCVLFGVDYNQMKNDKDFTETAHNELLLAVPLTLMVLAAKGFVLWLLNLVFAIVLSVLLTDYRKKLSNRQDDTGLLIENSTESPIYNSIYNAYGDTSVEQPAQQSWLNKMLSDRLKFNNILFYNNKNAKKSITTLPRIPTNRSDRGSIYNSYRSARNKEIAESTYDEVQQPEVSDSPIPNPDYSPQFPRRLEPEADSSLPKLPIRPVLKRY